MKRNEQCGITRMSRFANSSKAKELLDLSEVRGGQNCPRHCPQAEDALLLGDPMTIRDVAALLGCSPWTIRQKYMPQGLPYLRASHAGKLVFFHDQVIDWILRHQSEKAPHAALRFRSSVNTRRKER